MQTRRDLRQDQHRGQGHLWVWISSRYPGSNVFKASIRAAHSRSGKEELVALKQINQSRERDGFPITALREIVLLSKLKHKNIIDLIEVVTSKRSLEVFMLLATEKDKLGNVYLVSEYMEQDLLALIDRHVPLTAAQVKCIMQQILEGVNFLHTHDVMHRDIKGANILMSSKGEIKLADFGLARLTVEKHRMYTNPVVTLWYRAPELLLGSNNYTSAIDVWSVGCCFAELLNSQPLFNGSNEGKMLEQIYQKCGSPTEESWPGVTMHRLFREFGPTRFHPRSIRTQFQSNPKYVRGCKSGRVDSITLDLLDSMLVLNPLTRITARQALEHRYFTTEPLPCKPEELPIIKGGAHEYEVKVLLSHTVVCSTYLRTIRGCRGRRATSGGPARRDNCTRHSTGRTRRRNAFSRRRRPSLPPTSSPPTGSSSSEIRYREALYMMQWLRLRAVHIGGTRGSSCVTYKII